MEGRWLGILVLAICLVIGPLLGVLGTSPFEWRQEDNFDDVMYRMMEVTAGNCMSKPREVLYLPDETVSQLPRFNRLLSSIIYPNRTDLLHLHNMALNRAFFYSYMNQRLNKSEIDFPMQPGLMYHYFSAAADVTANEYFINGSALYYDSNSCYANWFRDLKFNSTLPLFGPSAYRFDDYNDPTNWLREPTNRTVDILDYGAGPQSDYTKKSYKTNEWYDLWLPDGPDQAGKDSVRKHPYDFKIKYANGTGNFISGDDMDEEGLAYTFYGPPSPGQNDVENLPVVYTQPYFDCGRSNKWIVSAVSPVVDFVPRYLEWFHLRRFRFTALSVQDMDFLNIDFNPCPHYGRDTRSYFQDTAKCKPTTMCEPLYGWGFRRGGYQCVCRSGTRYPEWQRRPFQGADIESATEEEYKNGFNCEQVGLRMVMPVIRGNETQGTPYTVAGRKKREVDARAESWDPPAWVKKHTNRAAKSTSSIIKSHIQSSKTRLLRMAGLEEVEASGSLKMHITARKDYHPGQLRASLKSTSIRQKLSPRYKRDTSHHRSKRQAFDEEAWGRMNHILEHKETVTRHNCKSYINEDLELPGDVSYGVEKLFGNQARVALRLSHFLSNFLQNVDRFEEYGNLRGDRLLNIEQIFGEVLANVMGDLKIKGSGVFFDIDKFEGPNGERRQFFGPFAYRYNEDRGDSADRVNTQYRAVDFAGLPDNYLDKPWYRNVKERWQSNTYGLTKFTEKPMIRSDIGGRSLKKFEIFPLYYYAPSVEDGWWSAPYFDCGGYYEDWIVTYSVPFFGLNDIRSAREFKGVVMVNVKLGDLNIQQCPQEYWVPNAFKATARCDFDSTYCENLPSRGFVRGSYKCECRQGFEYAFNDRAWYFDGQTMEEEYRKMQAGTSNRYETLKCRIAGAASNTASIATILCLLFIHVFTQS